MSKAIITIEGVIETIDDRWNENRTFVVFFLNSSTIRGFPEWLSVGQFPLRIRKNSKTRMVGTLSVGVDVRVVGHVSLNEEYKGKRLEPHVDADEIHVL